MNPEPINNQSPANEDDGGIDIRRLLDRIKILVQGHYRRLRLWVGLTTVVVVGVFMLGLFVAPPMTTYSEVVGFNFPQSEKAQYPNGSPFSITDITNRNVLDQVWRENQLESQGVSFQTFVNSVSVVAYADNEAFIRAKYQGMLARKNLNSADISAMERDYRTEIETQSKKQALITLTVPFSSPLSGSLAKKVLSDIPKAWSDQAINKLGALSIPMVETESVQEDVLKKGSPFQVLDYFYKSATQLSVTLSRIEAFPGGASLKDPESDLSVEDLKHRIADLTRYWILDFDNYVQQYNKASEIDIRSAEIHLKELKNRQQELLAEAHTYKLALQDYDATARQSKVASAQDYGGGFRGQGTGGSIQFDGDSLQRLIDIGSQNKDSEFRQELTRKRVTAELQAKSMDQEILRNERRISSARNSGVKGQFDPEKMKFYSDEIWRQLQSISGSIQRIQLMQQGKFKDNDGALYSAGGVAKSYASGVAARFFLPIGILVLLGLLGLSVHIINRFGRDKS